jgi:RNA-binding protein YlmH
MNEEELCKKRLIDLSRQAYNRDIAVYSDFLNLNELNIYHQSLKDFYCRTESFGGILYAERQIAVFLPDAHFFNIRYPICALKITPVYPKFSEELGHRDILGAIMNLGIERSQVGDIIISEDGYYVLCLDSIAPYFIDNLNMIRHTAVSLSVVDTDSISISQEFTQKDGIVSSVRIDAVIACVYRLSRRESLSLVSEGRVFSNGRLISNPGFSLKAGDIVSVRGMGRFVFDDQTGSTGKGRIRIRYKLYSR